MKCNNQFCRAGTIWDLHSNLVACVCKDPFKFNMFHEPLRLKQLHTEEMQEKEADLAKASADASGLVEKMEKLRSEHAAAVERGDGLEATMKDSSMRPQRSVCG